MIKADFRDVEKLVDTLDFMSDKGVGIAQKNTVNTLAFNTQKIARKDLDTHFVLRNKWSERSIMVDKARSITKPESVVGSVQPYMALQETGGVKNPKDGSKNIPIATGYASGEQGAKIKRKLPRGKNKLRKIELRRRPGKTRALKNYIAVRQAAKYSNKYVYLETSRSKGIYKVLGGKRKPRVKMVHNLSQKTVTIPKTKWLEPSADKAVLSSEQIYKKELRRQLVRAFK